MKTIAFIDGQNLHLGTKHAHWGIDFQKFRIFLKDKFRVTEAYYFLGYISEEEQDLYNTLQKAGFIVVFREHSANLKGKKKGNVDVDIVFEVMKNLIEETEPHHFVIVSGDGDYIKMIHYLIKRERLVKILFPNNQYSSLYNKIKSHYGMNLSLPDIRKKIEHVSQKEKTRRHKKRGVLKHQHFSEPPL
jgi:uncharacterized LabA/DUF88 family protein